MTDLTMTDDDISQQSEIKAKKTLKPLPASPAEKLEPIARGQDKKIKAPLEEKEEPSKTYIKYTTYERLIQDQIDYSSFSKTNQPFVDGIISVMLDLIMTESPKTIKIKDEIKSREVVKSVYLKLNSKHIEWVIERFKSLTKPITDKTAYLRSMLYNSYNELNAHYINEFRVDMADL